MSTEIPSIESVRQTMHEARVKLQKHRIEQAFELVRSIIKKCSERGLSEATVALSSDTTLEEAEVVVKSLRAENYLVEVTPALRKNAFSVWTCYNIHIQWEVENNH